MPPNPDSRFVLRLLFSETFFEVVFAFDADTLDFVLLLFEATAELLADALCTEPV